MVIQQAYKNIIDITLVAEPEVDLGSNRTGAHTQYFTIKLISS